MSFVTLQENLRRELRKRIDSGQLTGMELARRTGFTQAHISNFLNRKRGLKLGALDRMLKAVGLTLYDLLNPQELARFAEAPAGSDAEYAEVPLVEAGAAATSEVIVNAEVLEFCKLKRRILERLRPEPAKAGRKSWTRFVLIRVDAKEAAGLGPRIPPGALLLLDRHANSLRSARKGERSLYAVRRHATCIVRYVEPGSGWLALRPHNPDSPVEVLPVPEGQSAADLLVGRVVYCLGEM
jgi:transcriptional regulator with XRE-family HTH domain